VAWGEDVNRRALPAPYVAGVDALKNVSEADRARLQHQYQASMTAGDERLKT